MSTSPASNAGLMSVDQFNNMLAPDNNIEEELDIDALTESLESFSEPVDNVGILEYLLT